MKKLLLISILFCLALGNNAQDIIYFPDNTNINCKIIDYNEKVIKYLKSDNLEGPTYYIPRSDILLVDTEKGYFYNKSQMLSKIKPKYSNNIFYFHVFDILINDFTFSYERLLNQGQLGMQIPIGFGINNSNEFQIPINTFYSGVSVNYYPLGQKKWTFITGPEFRYGMLKYSYSDASYTPWEIDVQSKYFKFFYRNGIAYNPINTISIVIFANIGIQHYEVYKEVNKIGSFNLNLGYRF